MKNKKLSTAKFLRTLIIIKFPVATTIMIYLRKLSMRITYTKCIYKSIELTIRSIFFKILKRMNFPFKYYIRTQFLKLYKIDNGSNESNRKLNNRTYKNKD